MGSNLEVFLEAATPQLRWRSAPMDCFEAPSSVWQLDKRHVVDYFTLDDLWEHYAESSAYGLAVPLRLDHAGDDDAIVTQHFVPYLSAVQIYTAKPLAIPRSIMGSETDSWSDGSSIGDKLSRSWDAASDDSSNEELDAVPARQQSGHLSFQYREWDPPYERSPLSDKVAELAQDYPCLTSLKSAELSPSSWLSVAWYPIYHIPAHVNLKGISSCFLTYHCISSVFQDKILVEECGGSDNRTVALSPFGMATYRMDQGRTGLWNMQPTAAAIADGRSSRRLSDLHWAAASWLKQVGAQHPDFDFFTSAIIRRSCMAAQN